MTTNYCIRQRIDTFLNEKDHYLRAFISRKNFLKGRHQFLSKIMVYQAYFRSLNCANGEN